MTNRKYLKMHFRVQILVRVKFELKNNFKTMNSSYPKNLGLLGIFLSGKGQLKIIGPLSHYGWLYIMDNFFQCFYELINDQIQNFWNFYSTGRILQPFKLGVPLSLTLLLTMLLTVIQDSSKAAPILS